jgi:hypothetical protein
LVAIIVALFTEIAVYSGLLVGLSIIIFDPTNVPNSLVFTILPCLICNAASFLSLGASSFADGLRVKPYAFTALGGIIGCLIGILRAIDVSYYPFTLAIIVIGSTGVAFVRALIDSAFFMSACAFFVASIARSRVNNQSGLALLGLILSALLACIFSLSERLGTRRGSLVD